VRAIGAPGPCNLKGMPAETVKSVDMRRLSRSRGGDAEIAELAARQHGVVGRRQLAELGFRPSGIDRRLRLGRLHRLHAGVYAVGHEVVSREGTWMAGACVRARCRPEPPLRGGALGYPTSLGRED
jgi:Transcriptional regulator, AbiEi antitoxin